MNRNGMVALGASLVMVVVAAGVASSQKAASAAPTKQQKIENATSAAPAGVSAKAMVMDWPAKDGDKPVMLREGANGWMCFPDFPATDGNDPMCMDESWMKWMDAYMAQKPPQISSVGISYMLAPGGVWASNTDPYGMTKTADNEWGFDGPHTMIVVPDPSALKGLPTKRSAGPFVMYAGTPYAHIMIPTSAQGGLKP